MIPHEFVRKVPLPDRNPRCKPYHWVGLEVRKRRGRVQVKVFCGSELSILGHNDGFVVSTRVQSWFEGWAVNKCSEDGSLKFEAPREDKAQERLLA